MNDFESMKGVFFEVLNRFGESNLNVDQLRCFKKNEIESSSWNCEGASVTFVYQCPLEECLEFLEETGEKELVDEMRSLPERVEKYTLGGLVPDSNRFFTDVLFEVSFFLFLPLDDGSIDLEATEDIIWNNTAIEDDTHHSFYYYGENNNSWLATEPVQIEQIDSIYEEIKAALNKPEFSVSKMMNDFKAKIEPEISEVDHWDYGHDIRYYYPSLFKINMFRKIGDEVTLGKVLGKPISWTIYKVDEEYYSYLLLADRVLFKTMGENLTDALEECYSKCFSKDERARIIYRPDSTELLPLDDSQIHDEHLFLLNQLEFYTLFPDKKDRVRFSGRKHIPCWLRGNDDRKHITAAVTADGVVTELDSSETCGARPMLWMSAF